ncbi:glycosyltransferase [Alteromonas stellipolaris]|uniref:Glycosyltransferase n=2 Tax=Alteromonas stellipolaris TaxID=233316 RepID=A0AAW7Z5N7_9ALTE|nr:glycosyltransferase [Alteromonas stellipolaris]MDO6578819.1 glycosyltransferase [Alteromonas stellipolaris]
MVATSTMLNNQECSSLNYHRFARSFVEEKFEVIFLSLPFAADSHTEQSFNNSFESNLDGVKYLYGQHELIDVESNSNFDYLLKELDIYISIYRPSVVFGLENFKLQLATVISTKKANIPYFHECKIGANNSLVQQYAACQFTLDQDVTNTIVPSVILESNSNLQSDTSQESALGTLFDIKPLLSNTDATEKESGINLTGRLGGIFSVKKIELNSPNPTWYSVEVSKLKNVQIHAKVKYNHLESVVDKKAVMLLKILDEDGNDFSKTLPKLAYSSHLASKFKYISSSDNEIVSLLNLDIPEKAKTLQIGFGAFNCSAGQSVELTDFNTSVKRKSKDSGVKSLLTSQPSTYTFSVQELLPHSLKANLVFESVKDKSEKALIAGVTYFDQHENVIEPPYVGFLPSKSVGPCAYLKLQSENILKLIPPRNAKKASVKVQSWHAKNKVWLDGSINCHLDVIESTTEAGPIEVLNSRKIARPLSKIKVAGILDEFTLECFRMEVDLVSISPTNWEQELEESAPDFLFVESCWFGNKNQWGGLMYGYTSNGPNQMDALINVLNYCRKKAIPTIFWSKEDPVHYSRFAPTAKLFDYVYTTDANMVQNYQKEYGINAEPLSFFCQPKVHNPIDLIPRLSKAAFAGSYYSDKKERCDDFHAILGALEETNIEYDIYDRCLKRGVASLQFPEYFKKHVVGYLEPDEMWRAYKGYKYTVNMNTVKHSPTMFARRVYESLASGTPVISNYSEGVVTQFSGIVCASDSKKDIIEYAEMLKDEKEYKQIVEKGVRETLGRHTIADRLEQVCKRIGIPVIPHLPIVNAVITAGTVDMVEKARELVNSQTYFDKRLVVNLENSNELYPYLNMNSDKEIFRVLTEFAKPLEGESVELNLNDDIAKTLMEDVAIKTQYEHLHPAISEKQK